MKLKGQYCPYRAVKKKKNISIFLFVIVFQYCRMKDHRNNYGGCSVEISGQNIPKFFTPENLSQKTRFDRVEAEARKGERD